MTKQPKFCSSCGLALVERIYQKKGDPYFDAFTGVRSVHEWEERYLTCPTRGRGGWGHSNWQLAYNYENIYASGYEYTWRAI